MENVTPFISQPPKRRYERVVEENSLLNLISQTVQLYEPLEPPRKKAKVAENLSSGSKMLDELLVDGSNRLLSSVASQSRSNPGGFYSGRIYEVYGTVSSARMELILGLINSSGAQKSPTLYINSEYSLTSDLFDRFEQSDMDLFHTIQVPSNSTLAIYRIFARLVSQQNHKTLGNAVEEGIFGHEYRLIVVNDLPRILKEEFDAIEKKAIRNRRLIRLINRRISERKQFGGGYKMLAYERALKYGKKRQVFKIESQSSEKEYIENQKKFVLRGLVGLVRRYLASNSKCTVIFTGALEGRSEKILKVDINKEMAMKSSEFAENSQTTTTCELSQLQTTCNSQGETTTEEEVRNRDMATQESSQQEPEEAEETIIEYEPEMVVVDNEANEATERSEESDDSDENEEMDTTTQSIEPSATYPSSLGDSMASLGPEHLFKLKPTLGDLSWTNSIEARIFLFRDFILLPLEEFRPVFYDANWAIVEKMAVKEEFMELSSEHDIIDLNQTESDVLKRVCYFDLDKSGKVVDVDEDRIEGLLKGSLEATESRYEQTIPNNRLWLKEDIEESSESEEDHLWSDDVPFSDLSDHESPEFLGKSTQEGFQETKDEDPSHILASQEYTLALSEDEYQQASHFLKSKVPDSAKLEKMMDVIKKK